MIKYKIVAVYLLLILSLLVGCAESTDLVNKDIQEVKDGGRKEEHEVSYNAMSRKIWVSDGSEGVEDIFIYFNNIDSDYLEAILYTGKLPISSYSYYNPSYGTKLPCNIKGKVIDNKLEGIIKYDDLDYDISLTFTGDSFKVNLSIVGDSQEKQVIPMNNTMFRPYTLDDLLERLDEESEVTILSDFIVEGDINSWTEIKLLPMIVEDKKSHPVLLMINENNEILFRFDAPFQNGLNVTEVSVEDIDNNGLMDIVFILGDEDESIGGIVAWIFYQEDGLFYLDAKIQEELNKEFYDTLNLSSEVIKQYFKSGE